MKIRKQHPPRRWIKFVHRHVNRKVRHAYKVALRQGEARQPGEIV